MDDLMTALAQSLASAGPEWAAVLLASVLVVTKVLPMVKDHSDQRLAMAAERQRAQLDLEREREKRKADEARRLDLRDQERSRTEGRWLEQNERQMKLQEQTNASLEGMRTSLDTQNALMVESKERSRNMARQVDEVHGVIVRREGTD